MLHPHPKYNNLPRIQMKIFDRQLQKLWGDNEKPWTPDFDKINSMKIEDYKCTCSNKIAFEKILAPHIETSNPICYKTCPHTVIAAAKRQMKAAPTPEPKVADDFVKFAKDTLEKEVGHELTNFGYSFTQWMNHLSKSKQDRMQAIADIYENPSKKLDMNPILLKKIEKQYYEGIGKVELQPADGKPRMVCSIPDKTKYIMGPITWKLEEIMQDNLEGYCGGKNLDEMADKINHYIDEGFTKVVEGDGSAFDNTQDVSLKEVDRYIYRRVAHAVYHVPREDFLKESQKLYKTMNIVVNDAITKKQKTLFQYSILGTVFSGDADTTLCNTIRMALYNRYVNEKAGLRYGKDYVCFSKGDDFTVMYKPYVKDSFIDKLYYRYFLPANPDPSKPDTRIYGIGQVLKFLEKGPPSIIKFCSLRAWYIDEQQHIYLTRDPAKLYTLAAYSRKTKSMNAAQKYEYLMAQATALDKTYKNVRIFEVMRDIYIEHANLIRKYHPRVETDLKRFMISKLRKEKESKMRYEPENIFYRIWYNVTGRNTFYKIQENYWQTMQLIEKAHVRQLTKEQADYVNKQIEMEFSIHYLKALLGLK